MTRRIIASISSFFGVFAFLHLFYWFMMLEWIWLDQWEVSSRGLALCLALYVTGVVFCLLPSNPADQGGRG